MAQSQASATPTRTSPVSRLAALTGIQQLSAFILQEQSTEQSRHLPHCPIYLRVAAPACSLQGRNYFESSGSSEDRRRTQRP